MTEIVRHVAGMAWKLAWGLVLGFALSAVARVCLRKAHVAGELGEPSLRSLLLAGGLGTLSSSCSYAAASLSSTLLQKGAHLVNTNAFLVASTNLVIEIGLVIWMLLGWRFVVAEIVGGMLLIGIGALVLRALFPRRLADRARQHLRERRKPRSGDHEGVEAQGLRTLRSREAWVAVGRTFRSDWSMVGRDIVLGVAIAGTLAAAVPDEVWQRVFPQSSATGTSLGALGVQVLVGPLVAVLSFVCSVGNIPLAAVLWDHGVSFAGVISFIFADLVTIPMLALYRRYYGWLPALTWAGCLLISIVATALCVEALFRLGHQIPPAPPVPEVASRSYFAWDYTALLNAILVPLGLALAFVGRRRGG